MHSRKVTLFGGVLAGALVLAGCSGSSEGGDSNGDGVTIEWWHIQTQEPQRGVWESLAQQFEDENPGVNVEITVQNDPEFKTGIDARAQAGDLPDVFQTWGGGVLAQQVQAGLVQDLTDPSSGWIDNLATGAVSGLQIDGQQYGVPYDSGLVGFWYNKALFTSAGIDTPPTTWDELLAAVDTLKSAGVTPIALGEGDKWPGMFFWAQGALAAGGEEPLQAAAESGDFSDPAFVEAGDRIVDLVDADAFQEGFLGASYAEAGGSTSLFANGEAGMELQGSWGPGTQASVAANGEGLGDDLGWFPYPMEDQSGIGFGGINGFAVGADAPPEAVDFLEFLSSVKSQTVVGEAGQLIPVANGAEDSIQNPLQRQIRDQLVELDYLQVFLDQAFSPAVGTAINDSVQGIFAGTLSPQQATEEISSASR